MEFNDIFKSVETLDKNKGYWFVRTDSGLYFNTYVDNGFIAIGWNQITVEDLKTLSKSDIVRKIAESEGYDLEINKEKGIVTSIYNKLKRFQELKKGDLVIIPSDKSTRYAFGVIEDTNIHVNIDSEFDCIYYKRKKVKWLEIKRVKDLDPIFYQIKVSRHAISDISRFDNYIDNVTNNLYTKDGYTHYVIDINTKDDINLKTLLTFVTSIQDLSQKINKEFSFNEDIDSSSIKLYLQSPGIIEIKLFTGKSLIALALIINILSCSDQRTAIELKNNSPKEIGQFMEVNVDTMEVVNQCIRDMEMNQNHMNSLE